MKTESFRRGKNMRYYANRSYVLGTFDIKIKDEEGNDRYVFSNQGKVGYNYALCDTSGKKYADIKQVISFRNKIRIQTDTKEIEMSFKYPFKINPDPYCKFKGLNWITEGDIHHHEYCVHDESNVVARVGLTGTQDVDANAVTKALNNMHRDLEIECSDEYDAPLILAVVIAIELAECSAGTHSSS